MKRISLSDQGLAAATAVDASGLSSTGEDSTAPQGRQPSRILRRRARTGPASRTNSEGVPAYFVGAYIPEDLHQRLTEDAAENERTISGQIIYLLKTHYREEDC